MKWYRVFIAGQQYKIQASSPAEAVQKGKTWAQQNGIGATDIQGISADNGDFPYVDQIQALPDVAQIQALPGSGGDSSGGLGGAADQADFLSRRREFARPAYMTGLSRAGYNPQGAFGGILQDRFAPAYADYWANTGLTQGRKEDTGALDFQTYSAQNTGNRDLWGAARDKFRQIAGGAAFGNTPESADAFRNVRQGINYGQGATQPGAQGLRDNLENLARAAAFSQYGDWGTTLLPTEDALANDLQQQVYDKTNFAALGGADQSGVNWADILRKRFGLR